MTRASQQVRRRGTCKLAVETERKRSMAENKETPKSEEQENGEEIKGEQEKKK